MTTRKSSTPNQIKTSFDQLFNNFTDEELLEQEARLLSFQFLSEIESAMEKQRMSKKDLAEKVNTSASYITQLFRGDRLANFNILAKIQRALDLKFEIIGKEIHSQTSKIGFDFPELEMDYGFYGVYKNLKPDYSRSIDRFKAEYNEGKVA
ncbi:helix-turn-helix domain-containing protein [Daejeonella sp. H1SJ63]|uniref:helix-turn-helix domain-containing protein n=1 Tax=Daejeonella sp. H1SJ63 TaxID=3034145 RepID=UPI0023EAE6D8|nr:helix-turn-helix domain-containing protein [Daejeonella sp. H1SJ63]